MTSLVTITYIELQHPPSPLRVIEEMRKGQIERVFVEGSEGTIISMNAGPNAVLTVSSSKNAKIGLIFLEMGRAARKIADLL